jgi:hypothetical protein
MTNKMPANGAHSKYIDIEQNTELALKLFDNFYRDHRHTGKLYSDIPEFFLVKPGILEGREIATRPSEKLLLDDVIRRAKERDGYIGVFKLCNEKLGYFWLDLSVLPFRLGDAVTESNRVEFFYILGKFIEYSKSNPKMYGDLTAELDADKDLALMFDGIGKMSEPIRERLSLYPESFLLSFNHNWPATEVKKLLATLKENDQGWCQVIFEYMMYVMGKKV